MSCARKINENSSLALNSALNIFSIPPTNAAVTRSFFREILPLSTVSQEGPYLFSLFSDNLWTDLSQICLHLELRIERYNDVDNVWEALDAGDTHLAPIQLLGQTFIQQLIVSVGTTEVYNSGTLYPYKAYITNELSYPKSVKESFLGAAGYYPIEDQDSAADTGFQHQCRRFVNSQLVHVQSRLDFDLSNQELYLLNQIDVLFTIYRARDSFLLHCLRQPNARRYRLYLNNIKLYAKMIDVQPALNVTIHSALEKHPATYAVRKTDVKAQFISAGRTEFDYNCFSSTIPRRITIALIEHAAFDGALAHSPFNFKPFRLRTISVHAGGHIFPQIPYNLDFANEHSTRAYVDMYEALGMANSAHSMDISLKRFNSGWTFFVIPLTSTLDDSCGFELLKSGTTTLRLQFDAPVPAGGIEMIILGEFDQMILVDQNRRVITDSTLG